MKTITVIGFSEATDIGHENPKLSTLVIKGPEEMDASDGYHTFTQLYDHRITLYIALCSSLHSMNALAKRIGAGIYPDVWRSKLHSDGSSFEGWFILGIGKEKSEQITYHLPLSRWEETNFAETLDKAPEWDGHTSEDILNRLKNL